MTTVEAIVLAVVEGLTEFLPISSTGHMMITQWLMGMESSLFVRSFTVMIQLGAILSVVVLYYKRFFTLNPSLGESETANSRAGSKKGKYSKLIRFYLNMIIGCIPAAVIGLLLDDYIDKLLSDVIVVAITLLLGGVFMLFIDRIFKNSNKQQVKPKNAFIVGCFQCIAMIPGVSRSMATIVGGLQQGLNRKTAAEFSFFLAVPTMLGATLLKGYKLYKEGGLQIFQDNATTLIIGNIVAFIVAMLAIRFFINYLTRNGFAIFGWYRIVVGAILLALVLGGASLELKEAPNSTDKKIANVEHSSLQSHITATEGTTHALQWECNPLR